jgi:Fic family protein
MIRDMTDAAPASAGWPRHGVEVLPWQQRTRGGSREDRMMTSVEATIPPYIRDGQYRPAPSTSRRMEDALQVMAAADAESQGHSVALSRFLIRSESVASSKIERIEASATDYARASAGSRANSSATSMVAASHALHQMVTAAGDHQEITRADLLMAHHALMRDDPREAEYAGRMRDMQNWIGGSDYSPRGALHVPPAPERVEDLMADLLKYLGRRDVPKLAQAALAHAQFESIHPFTDGNGRIGRALVNASLRSQGATRHAVVPIASGILARRDNYFAALGAYRSGDADPIVELFTLSAHVGAEEARVSIARLKELPDRWRGEVKARKGSAAHRLAEAFYDNPVLIAADVEKFAGTSATQTNLGLTKLEDAGIIQEITGRKRDRAWVATEVTAELDDLDRRIAAAMR